MTKSVFISYVQEDALAAQWLASELQAIGVWAWLDKQRLKGGDVWRTEISNAIRDADYFVPVFSSSWVARNDSVAFEELAIAADEAKQRDARYIIPIKLGRCNLRAHSPTAKHHLADLHYIEFHGRSTFAALREIALTVGASGIRIDQAEPLAVGLPAQLQITNGAIVTEKTDPSHDALEGIERQIMSGHIFRAVDNTIRFHATLRAPFQGVQHLEKQFGLNEISTATEDAYISTSVSKLTQFVQRNRVIVPAGTTLHSSFLGIGSPKVDLDVVVERRFRLCVERRSVVGLLDSAIHVLGHGVDFEQRQWAGMQAAYICPANPK